MNLREAILKRIYEISKEKNLSISELCLLGGISPSPIYDLAKERTKSSTVSTIKHFCEGAGITLKEFFDREYFNDVDE